MMRYNLVFKKVHYRRRGAIEQKYIDDYLNEIASTVDKYGPKFVINMDETSVKTHNFSSCVISLKGKDDVSVIKDNLNTKDETTFIATISMDHNMRIY